MELRPLDPAHAAALQEILATPEVHRWWGPPDPGFPLTDHPDLTRFTILVDGEIAGMVQFGEEPEPEYRHAWIDIFIAARFTGRGVGPEVLRRLIEMLQAERGHHRITIDPAADNVAAVRAYEKAGFRRAGVHEKAWRDPSGVWRDVQFMELVVAPPG